MALQIIQFHSLQMEIEKKASTSEMCHSDHWNAPNGDPLRLLISSIRVIWGNVAYVQEAPDSGGLHTHAQKKKQLRVFFKFEDLLNCQDISKRKKIGKNSFFYTTLQSQKHQ